MPSLIGRTATAPAISVIIPVHNSAGPLSQCLAALRRSERAPMECIVVDDDSSDNSAEVAQQAAVHLLKTGERRGPAVARNLGAMHARGEILMFLDADVCVHSDTLGRIAQEFAADSGLDAVIGSYDDTPASQGFCSKYRNLMHCFMHQTGCPRASTFWTGCGAVRKRVFTELGGFNERHTLPSIEDIEFGYRMTLAGCRIVLDRAVQVKHLKEWTLGEMLKTDIVRRGVPWTRLILRYRKMPNDLNLRWSQRVSVPIAWSVAGFSALAVALGLRLQGTFASRATAGAVVCLLAMLILNLPFYRFLAKTHGVRFALAAAPLHWLHHFLNGIAFAAGLAMHLWAPAGSEADVTGFRRWIFLPDNQAAESGANFAD